MIYRVLWRLGYRPADYFNRTTRGTVTWRHLFWRFWWVEKVEPKRGEGTQP